MPAGAVSVCVQVQYTVRVGVTVNTFGEDVLLQDNSSFPLLASYLNSAFNTSVGIRSSPCCVVHVLGVVASACAWSASHEVCAFFAPSPSLPCVYTYLLLSLQVP